LSEPSSIKKQGQIIIVYTIFAGMAFLPNQMIFFDSCEKLYEYLLHTTDQPFIIVSDINIPGTNGIEIRERIQANDYLRQKSIPFVYLTTASNPETIKKAYELMVQGYFIKPTSFGDFQKVFQLITQYWSVCKHPNN
jgi:DNA-binding NarL/FixJ family response regulator